MDGHAAVAVAVAQDAKSPPASGAVVASTVAPLSLLSPTLVGPTLRLPSSPLFPPPFPPSTSPNLSFFALHQAAHERGRQLTEPPEPAPRSDRSRTSFSAFRSAAAHGAGPLDTRVARPTTAGGGGPASAGAGAGAGAGAWAQQPAPPPRRRNPLAADGLSAQDLGADVVQTLFADEPSSFSLDLARNPSARRPSKPPPRAPPFLPAYQHPRSYSPSPQPSIAPTEASTIKPRKSYGGAGGSAAGDDASTIGAGVIQEREREPQSDWDQDWDRSPWQSREPSPWRQRKNREPSSWRQRGVSGALGLFTNRKALRSDNSLATTASQQTGWEAGREDATDDGDEEDDEDDDDDDDGGSPAFFGNLRPSSRLGKQSQYPKRHRDSSDSRSTRAADEPSPFPFPPPSSSSSKAVWAHASLPTTPDDTDDDLSSLSSRHHAGKAAADPPSSTFLRMASKRLSHKKGRAAAAHPPSSSSTPSLVTPTRQPYEPSSEFEHASMDDRLEVLGADVASPSSAAFDKRLPPVLASASTAGLRGRRSTGGRRPSTAEGTIHPPPPPPPPHTRLSPPSSAALASPPDSAASRSSTTTDGSSRGLGRVSFDHAAGALLSKFGWQNSVPASSRSGFGSTTAVLKGLLPGGGGGGGDAATQPAPSISPPTSRVSTDASGPPRTSTSSSKSPSTPGSFRPDSFGGGWHHDHLGSKASASASVPAATYSSRSLGATSSGASINSDGPGMGMAMGPNRWAKLQVSSTSLSSSSAGGGVGAAGTGKASTEDEGVWGRMTMESYRESQDGVSQQHHQGERKKSGVAAGLRIGRRKTFSKRKEKDKESEEFSVDEGQHRGRAWSSRPSTPSAGRSAVARSDVDVDVDGGGDGDGERPAKTKRKTKFRARVPLDGAGAGGKWMGALTMGAFDDGELFVQRFGGGPGNSSIVAHRAATAAAHTDVEDAGVVGGGPRTGKVSPEMGRRPAVSPEMVRRPAVSSDVQRQSLDAEMVFPSRSPTRARANADRSPERGRRSFHSSRPSGADERGRTGGGGGGGGARPGFLRNRAIARHAPALKNESNDAQDDAADEWEAKILSRETTVISLSRPTSLSVADGADGGDGSSQLSPPVSPAIVGNHASVAVAVHEEISTTSKLPNASLDASRVALGFPNRSDPESIARAARSRRPATAAGSSTSSSRTGGGTFSFDDGAPLPPPPPPPTTTTRRRSNSTTSLDPLRRPPPVPPVLPAPAPAQESPFPSAGSSKIDAGRGAAGLFDMAGGGGGGGGGGRPRTSSLLHFQLPFAKSKSAGTPPSGFTSPNVASPGLESPSFDSSLAGGGQTRLRTSPAVGPRPQTAYVMSSSSSGGGGGGGGFFGSMTASPTAVTPHSPAHLSPNVTQADFAAPHAPHGLGSGPTSAASSASLLPSPTLASVGALSGQPSPAAPKHVQPMENDTPESFLQRVTATVARKEIANVLAGTGDPTHVAALQTYMTRFHFLGDPLDVALRKLLMELCLPTETQQIDRVMEAFAKRYNECNRGLFVSDDQPYLLAFSLMMLHTDAFNKNNKNKMTKADYVRNTSGSGIPVEILDYLFDNLTFTQFIYVDEDVDVHGNRRLPEHSQSSSALLSALGGSSGGVGKNKIDPYYLITQGRLGEFRPDVESLIPLGNPFSFTGTDSRMPFDELHIDFAFADTIEIVTSRRVSLPVASGWAGPEYPSPQVLSIMEEAREDKVVSLKVTKLGMLNRKDDLTEGGKKASSRKWKTWAVLLTGSQLLFFKDTAWAAALLSRMEEQTRDNPYGAPKVILPRMSYFRPDAVLSTADTVAMLDTTYSKYDHVFRFVAPHGRQYLFQAQDEQDANDWIQKINYCASFKSANLKMRSARVVSVPQSPSSPAGPSPSPSFYESSSYSSRSGAAAPAAGGGKESLATFALAREVSRASTALEGPTRSISASKQSARVETLRNKLRTFGAQLAKVEAELEAEMRIARGLAVLTPFQRSTRERIEAAVPPLAKRIRALRIEVAKYGCWHTVLSDELAQCERLFTGQAEVDIPSVSIRRRTSSQRSRPSPKRKAPDDDEDVPTSPRSVDADVTSNGFSSDLADAEEALERDGAERREKRRSRSISRRPVSFIRRSSQHQHQHEEETDHEEVFPERPISPYPVPTLTIPLGLSGLEERSEGNTPTVASFRSSQEDEEEGGGKADKAGKDHPSAPSSASLAGGGGAKAGLSPSSSSNDVLHHHHHPTSSRRISVSSVGSDGPPPKVPAKNETEETEEQPEAWNETKAAQPYRISLASLPPLDIDVKRFSLGLRKSTTRRSLAESVSTSNSIPEETVAPSVVTPPPPTIPEADNSGDRSVGRQRGASEEIVRLSSMVTESSGASAAAEKGAQTGGGSPPHARKSEEGTRSSGSASTGSRSSRASVSIRRLASVTIGRGRSLSDASWNARQSFDYGGGWAGL